MNAKPMLTAQEALQQLLADVSPVSEVESLPLLAATGRVLAYSQHADLSVPPMDNTQMDGYAVRAQDCAAGGARLRVSQRLPAGYVGTELEAGTAARIFTGANIPPGADAVVMQEQCQAEVVDGVTYVTVKHQPQVGEWIRRIGEDIQQGSEILPAGCRLRAQELGLAASVGLAQLPVRRRLRVAVFFTGDELAMPGEPLRPGAIYNSNRFALHSLLRQLDCDVTDFGIVPDSLAATRDTLRAAALEHDVIITSGGVSVGEEDHVKPAVELEGQLKMWQIAIKPGKPLAFGTVRRNTDGTLNSSASSAANASSYFLGLPGNPVSSFVTFLLFVRPFLMRLQGQTQVNPTRITMRADFAWPKADKRNEFLRVKINAAGGLDLFPHQGSAVMSSLVWGDGLLDNPPGNAIAIGDSVQFMPFAHLFS